MKKTRKILIVDSDTNYIIPLRNSLSKVGYEVVCWDDGQKALELAKSFQADMIISEVELPKVSGHVLFKELRSVPACKTTPFIFLSSQKRVDDRIKSMELGVDDYITKPFYVEEVVARVEALFKEVSKLNDGHGPSEKGFSGNLSEMNLVDLIQTLELGKKSAILKLKHNAAVGLVYVKDGEVIDASLADLSPDMALLRMFTWTIGNFLVDIAPVEREKRVQTSNKELVNMGLRRINEWNQIKEGLPPINSAVMKTQINSYDELSNEERAMITNINEKKFIYEIIEKSELDDLKALEVMRSLYQKGYLQEIEDSSVPYMDDYVTKLKQNVSTTRSTTERVLSIVSNVFKKQEEDREEQLDPQNDRRQIPDRRKGDRRRFDRLRGANQIYLTKTELLMIRERLS
ncbi:MAG: response regulator [Candidatus Zhuqueibacterota bacterium]